MVQQRDPAQGGEGWPGKSSARWGWLDGGSRAVSIGLSSGLAQTSGLRHLPALFEVVLCALTERNSEFSRSETQELSQREAQQGEESIICGQLH